MRILGPTSLVLHLNSSLVVILGLDFFVSLFVVALGAHPFCVHMSSGMFAGRREFGATVVGVTRLAHTASVDLAVCMLALVGARFFYRGSGHWSLLYW